MIQQSYIYIYILYIYTYTYMLPQLNKKRNENTVLNARNSQPHFTIDDMDKRDASNSNKAISAKKIRTGGGFMKYNNIQDTLAKPNPTQMLLQQQNYQKYAKPRRTQDLSAEIKLIEKKIKACQKKIQQDRKRQKILAQQATRDQQRSEYNFDKVVQRELQLQGYHVNQANNQNFDYLTNPQLKPGQDQQFEPQQISQQKPLVVAPTPYDIQAGVQKLQKHYENSLKKKFERRQMFPHQACRRKTPKLYITHKTNTVTKYGKPQSDAQHLFRVLTKETTPQQIYPTIPNFAVVKDNLSKNIVAYLGDYRPFLQKTKETSNNYENEEGNASSIKKQRIQQAQAKGDDKKKSIISIKKSQNLSLDTKNQLKKHDNKSKQALA